jgi:hypothetical protein
MSLGIARKPAVLALSALLVACGSGGGAPTTLSAATLSGLYLAVAFGGQDHLGESDVGKATADGAGRLSMAMVVNDGDGGPIGPPLTLGYFYTVASDGTTGLSWEGAPGVELMRGGVSADGGCALLATSRPDILPFVQVLLRRGGSYDTASLAGSYRVVFFGTSLSGITFAFTGLAGLDGAGSGAAPDVVRNTTGAITASSVSLTYTVLIDGSATVADLASSESLDGAVVEGGDLAVFGGGITTGQMPATMVLLRAATAASAATFSGSYWIVSLSRDASTGDYRSLTGTLTADGAGALTLVGTSDTEGALVDEPAATAAYSVAADGTLTVNDGATTLVGGVTADGRFAVLGGAVTSGSDPTLAILCRK